MIKPGTYTRIQAWRKFRYAEGAFVAKCRNGSKGGLRPEMVDIARVGHHSSIVFNRGTRLYSFQTEEGRDAFVKLYAGFGAEACEDPYP